MAVRRWVIIAAGAVILVVMVGLGLIGTGAYLLYRQVDVQTTSAAAAQREFEQARAQFPGQKPYLEISREGRGALPTINRDLERQDAAALTTVHALIWNPREDKVVRLSLPFWLVRLTSRGKLSLGDEFGRDLTITAEDLERRGPGLILDHQEPGGERVLVWTQ